MDTEPPTNLRRSLKTEQSCYSFKPCCWGTQKAFPGCQSIIISPRVSLGSYLGKLSRGKNGHLLKAWELVDAMDAHLRIVWWLSSTVTTPRVTHTAGSQFSNKNIPKSLNVAKLIIYARQQRWALCLTISHQERMKMCLLPSKQNSTYPCKYCMPRPQIRITVTGHKHWMCW